MNTDKIYAERIASEYAPKETSKIIALKRSEEHTSELSHANESRMPSSA